MRAAVSKHRAKQINALLIRRFVDTLWFWSLTVNDQNQETSVLTGDDGHRGMLAICVLNFPSIEDFARTANQPVGAGQLIVRRRNEWHCNKECCQHQLSQRNPPSFCRSYIGAR